MNRSQAKHYAVAVAQWLAAGRPKRDPAEVVRIEETICKPCDSYRDGRCLICGCRVNRKFALVNKIAMATEICPKGKWDLVDEEATIEETLPPVDVVFTLSSESKHNDIELRVALRSLEKFARGLGRVFVVGHKPSWLTGVTHIPHRTPHRNKDADIINKLSIACRSGISERFIFASDDQCLLCPTMLQHLKARFCAMVQQPNSGWRRRLVATTDWLREQRGIEQVFHFDTHVWQPHSRDGFLRAIDGVPYDTKVGMTVNTLVLNQCADIPREHIGRSRGHVHQVPFTGEQLTKWLSRAQWFGYDDGAITPAYLEVVSRLFPSRSKYEADEGIMTITTQRPQDGMISRGNTRGLMLQEELDAVVAAIPDDGLFLEIGTYHGLSASIIAEQRPKASIISVDLLKGVNNAKWQSNRRENMRLIVGTSADLMLLGLGRIFDTILVDGDHRCAPCHADLVAAQQLLKPGGTLLAHDYCRVPGTHVRGQAGVAQAVDAFCTENGLAVSRKVGSLAVIATAWAILEVDVECRTEFPTPDPNRIQVAEEQAKAADGSTIDEILDAIP